MKKAIFTYLKSNKYLFGVTFLASFVSLYGSAKLSFGFDESFSILVSRNWNLMLNTLWNREANMWFYYIILHFWQYFGSGEFVVRALSAIFAVATIPIVYLLGKSIASRRVGLIASTLLALNVVFVLYAQEARSYTLVMFLTSLSSLAYLNIEKNIFNKIVFVAASVLSVYSHFYAGFVLITQTLNSVFSGKIKKLAYPLFVISVFVLPLIASPSMRSHQVDWITKPGLQSLIGTAFFLTGDHPVLFVVEFFLLLTLSPFIKKHLINPKYRYLLSWFAFPILFSFFFSVAVKPIYQSTYFTICLPPIMLLVALAIENLNKVIFKKLFLGAILIFSLFRLYSYYSEDTSTKWVITNKRDDWKSAVLYVVKNGTPKDSVIVYPYHEKLLYTVYSNTTSPKLHEVTTEYYLPAGGKKLPEPNMEVISTIDTTTVWLFAHRSNNNIMDHKAQINTIFADLQRKYKVKEKRNFFGLELTLF